MPAAAADLVKMLTLEQVAEQLQIDERTVRRHCTKGDLEFVKIGPKTLRFKPAWVEAFIKRKQGR
jgi:excisionase family DNA binding protein